MLDMTQRCLIPALLLIAAGYRQLPAQRAVVSGTVKADGSERPIRNAEVQIVDLKLVTRSDSVGNFTFNVVPPGSHSALVRMAGYKELSATFTSRANQKFEGDYLLAPTATELKRVDVKADATRPFAIKLEEFDERRAHGLGHYITAPEFEKQQGKPLSAFIKEYVPGVNIVQSGSKKWMASGRSAGACGKVFQTCAAGERDSPNFDKVPAGCYTRVVVNSRIVFNGDARREMLFDLDGIQSQDIIGLEYYTTATAPAKYAGTTNGSCGVLILWTKGG